MSRLVCGVCGAEEELPKACHGDAILNDKDDTKLMCPEDGKEVAMPKHCGKPMKYVTVPSWAVLSR
jgi:hypothetical protein